jgi:hypothetical protein
MSVFHRTVCGIRLGRRGVPGAANTSKNGECRGELRDLAEGVQGGRQHDPSELRELARLRANRLSGFDGRLQIDGRRPLWLLRS